MIGKLQSQIEFIAEIDKLKNVLRRTSPIGLDRKENSAEHCWQVIITAMTLQEYANFEVDLLRVIKMLALHDIVEIDCGDTFHYDKAASKDLYDNELACAQRIFNKLPEEQADSYLSLWKEFEAKETNDSLYANSVDRLMAFIMNYYNKGGSWKDFNLKLEQILEKNEQIKNGSQKLWEFVQEFAIESKEKGYIVN